MAGSAEKIAQKTAEREGSEGGGGGGVAGTGSSKAGPSQGIADADKELRRAAIALAAEQRAEEEGSEGKVKRMLTGNNTGFLHNGIIIPIIRIIRDY